MSGLARIDSRDLGRGKLVRVRGEIDLSNVHQVMDDISAAVPGDACLVILDLSGTSYLDSSGIAMIYRFAERLGHRRQQLRLVVPEDAPIRAVLELTNVPSVIPVTATVDDT